MDAMNTLRIDTSRCKQGCLAEVVSLSVAPNNDGQFSFGFVLYGGCGGPYSYGTPVDHVGLLGLKTHKYWSPQFKARLQREIEEKIAECVRRKWCSVEQAERFLSEVFRS